MKKLYSNINDIKIYGRPSSLYIVVTNLDKKIEGITNDTNKIQNLLLKYSDSNAGKQYELVITKVRELSKELKDSSEKINDLQRQVCKYIEKVNNYEGRHDYSIIPRRLNIKVFQTSANTQNILYTDDMKKILIALKAYVQNSNVICRNINNDRDNIGRIWKDRQYRDFSTQINELVSKIKNATLILNQYIMSLQAKIKELDS